MGLFRDDLLVIKEIKATKKIYALLAGIDLPEPEVSDQLDRDFATEATLASCRDMLF